MLGLLPPELAALRPFVPYIPPILVDSVSTFCSVDPPGWPDLTTAALGAVLAGGPEGAALVAAELITQTILNAYWYLACQCTGTDTPAPPTPTLLPPPQVDVNPPNVPLAPGLPCLMRVSPRFHAAAFNDDMMLIPASIVRHSADPKPVSYEPIPAGATTYSWTWDTGVAQTGTFNMNIVLNFANAAGTSTGSSLQTGKNSGLTGTVTGAVPAGTTQYYVEADSTSSGTYPSGLSCGAAVNFYCGSAPGASATPCCPPDPIMVGQVQQILNMVTLIQRQAAAFGYVYGANHASLSGDGDIAVSGLLGCSVDVTTLPSQYGSAAGDPDELFGLGWISMGTADGIVQRRRLDADGILFLPGLGGVFTSINYALSPGVVVSIRELVREP